MTAGAHSARWAGRVAAVTFLAIEPFALIALLLGAVAVTFLLTAREPSAQAVDAVVVPLELAVACWLLSARLECRAQAEETHLWNCFSGSAAILCMRPRSPGALTDVSAWLLTASLALGLPIVLHWQRPVAPRARSGEELLGELSEAQVRRISVGLNVGLTTTMLLIAVLGGLV